MADLLRTAVLATIRAEVRQDEDQFALIAHHLDVSTFLTPTGDIDMDAVRRFTSTVETTPAAPPATFDPVAAALARQHAQQVEVDQAIGRGQADYDYEQQFEDGLHARRPGIVPPDATVGEPALSPEYTG